MSDPEWIRAKQVFTEALAKTGPERAAFLAVACGDDAKLRSQVDGLLAAHEEAGEFLTSPTGAGAHAVAMEIAGQASGYPPEGPGSQIGPYKLLQLIGEGGFGVVYMADQAKPIRRRVALKIIKPGMDSREVIARFEAERQVLAMMDHPNVAKVLDAGATDSGHPYFVMELVKGVPITEYCDANRLSTRERLELFMDVCKAVHHAHEKGIVHRDIKPSNVMVTLHDGEPLPKVIDFGIAKATNQSLTEKTLFTAYGQFLGTPAYMSPEQAAISAVEIDRRSDVYSLGVLLYELLTGTTPFEQASLRSLAFHEVMRIIREEDPPTPSARLRTLGEQLTAIATSRHVDANALAKLLRGDLDWIVMRAIEKDRKRRYNTASEIARDLSRYFRHEPISARKPSAAYRLAKFAKRRRGRIIAGAGMAAAILLGGFAGRTWTNRRSGMEVFGTMYGSFLAEYNLEAFPRARSSCRAGAERYPKEWRYASCQLVLRATDIMDPNPDSAWRELKTLETLVPKRQKNLQVRRHKMFVATSLARAGLLDSARRVMESARADEDIDPMGNLLTAEALNRVLFGTAADTAEAFRLLKEYLISQPLHGKGFGETTHWWWRGLKKDPRWHEYLGFERRG